jgi:hypothetical protein
MGELVPKQMPYVLVPSPCSAQKQQSCTAIILHVLHLHILKGGSVRRKEPMPHNAHGAATKIALFVICAVRMRANSYSTANVMPQKQTASIFKTRLRTHADSNNKIQNGILTRRIQHVVL